MTAVLEWFENWLKDQKEAVLTELPMTMGAVRMTALYLSKTFEDSEINWVEIRQICDVRLDEFLQYRAGDVYNYAKMAARELEKEKLDDSMPVIRKKLSEISPSDKGFMKSSEILLRMAGREKGEPPPPEGLKVPLVKWRVVNGKAEKEEVASVLLPETKVLSTGEVS